MGKTTSPLGGDAPGPPGRIKGAGPELPCGDGAGAAAAAAGLWELAGCGGGGLN
jgi:hypothetical protein